MGTGVFALCVVAAACVVIWKACDYFEEGSTFLGRGMPAGVRGATINAIGSSLPELLTTFCLLFLFQDQDGYSAGIATCAGSAVFNAVIIPALVILVVPLSRGRAIVLDRATVLRDGAFFLAAEGLLIYFLGDSTLTWWMGAALLGMYLCYGAYLARQIQQAEDAMVDEDADTPTVDVAGRTLRSEFPTVGFEPPAVTSAGKAWWFLGASTFVIGVACYGLSWSVVKLAAWWQIPTYFTAVVFAAAATSVPDTILSIKDAQRGEYDDAIANAVGSNIFDITVCLGLPLLCYGLVYGDVHVSSIDGAASVQSLRVALLAVSVLVLGVLLIGRIGKSKGYALLGVYGLWMAYLVHQAWG
jgi:cation:H+ antiporter